MGPIAEIQQGMLPTPDGTRLCVYRLGRGDRTVIIPNALYLLEHFAYLARDFTVISYDLRNRGRSDPIHDESLLHRGVHHDVEDLETVRRTFDIEQAHLIGHSYLGLMVILYAIAHPHRVGRIVQIGAVAPDPGRRYSSELSAPDLDRIADCEAARRLRQLREQGMPESDPKGFCRHWWQFMSQVFVLDSGHADRIGDHFCEFENEWPVNMEQHLSRYIRPSLDRLGLRGEEIASVTSPVLVVHGRGDRNVPYGAGRDWAAQLPEARLLSVSQAAHMPYLEAPRTVLPAIERFLGGDWPEQAESVTGSTPGP